MKILNPFSFNDLFSWNWPSQHWRGSNFDAWQKPSTGTSTVYEIPIQYEGAYRHAFQEPLYENHYFDFSDDSSDSDCDCNIDPYSYNWNNNGARMRRKRRRGESVTPKLISSEDSLLQEAAKKTILVDSDDESKAVESDRQLRSKGKILKTGGSQSDGSCKRVLRSRAIEVDSEKQINDTSSYEVYTYLKALLLSTNRQIDAIKGDGNCFFRALSKVVYGAQGFYDEIRQAVVDVMEKHPKRFEQFADQPMKDHISDMRLDKMWATQTDIYAAATLLQRDIYILSPDQRKDDSCKWLLFSPQFRYSSDIGNCSCYITLCHTHGNHYDRIAPIGGSCNCDLSPPEMSGVKGSVDLTVDENEIVCQIYRTFRSCTYSTQ